MRAGLLLLVAEDLIAELDRWRGQVIAGVRLAGEAGLLQVEAGQHEDRGPGIGDSIDRCLEIAKTLAQALRVQPAVEGLQSRIEVRNPLLEVGAVVLADDQMGTR